LHFNNEVNRLSRFFTLSNFRREVVFKHRWLKIVKMKKSQQLEILLAVLHRPVPRTTVELAKRMQCSQQSASRLARAGEKEGIIAKSEADFILTTKGRAVLAEIAAVVEAEKKPLKVEGKVVAGLGEGAYYISKPGYTKQFVKKLGFKPFPGTLNVKTADFSIKATLQQLPGIEIDEFREKERTFGGAKCFPATVNGKKAALIIPHRSHYGAEILEFISPHNLRVALRLRGGCPVKAQIQTT